MERMVEAGMDIARLNFSHGDFAGHRKMIRDYTAAAQSAGKRPVVMADLPGTKIRVGQLAGESLELLAGSTIALTVEDIIGGSNRISVNFPALPKIVHEGDTLFLNDGFIQLEVARVQRKDVLCRVVVGGELRSGKGLNLPGIRLGIGAFTDRDRRCLQFALNEGVDAISQSFVETADDVKAVRRAAAEMGESPFLIAKIERARALDHIDSILEAADGIMIARGDLGVEIPIEKIAVVQKRLMLKANASGKPVITATHMLESMTEHTRPTRAEATDVANAILDGTDCVMLSGESATGKYPVEAVDMLARIAAVAESERPVHCTRDTLDFFGKKEPIHPNDLIAVSLETMLEHISPAALFIPTLSGTTARGVSRFRLPVWITAVSPQESTCRHLQFSYGVYPILEPVHPEDWRSYARKWLQSHRIRGDRVLLIEGPSPQNPAANHRLEIIDLSNAPRN
jgi:pyruvate kinase